MANNLKADTTIIGAGLTGLVTAFYLKKSGKNVLLLEKKNRCGGVINSISENGFTYECGPNSGVLSSIEAVELFEDLQDYCKLEIANQKAKKRLIWKNSRWEPLPSGIISSINTPLFSLKDKFRILGEPFRQRGTNPEESIAELVKRRLGKSFLDYAIDPFISGIYAGDPQKIVTKYALPKLYNLEQEFGSFIKVSVLKKKDTSIQAKKVTREVFSADGGLYNLILSLERAIGKESIYLSSEDINIQPDGDSFTTTFKTNDSEYEILSDKVVSTIGGYALPDIFKFIPNDDMDYISNLEYAKVVQVILGFKEWKGIELDAFGGLVPAVEKRKLLGVLYSSTLFRNRAPESGSLLSIFMGGRRYPEAISKTDDEIVNIIKDEMCVLMGLSEFKPDLLKIFRYHNAIPQYEKSSGMRLQKITEIETKYPGLILAGNIRDGIGMSDRIKQAKLIADSLI